MYVISLIIMSSLTFWARWTSTSPRGATGFHARPSQSGLDDVRAKLRRGIVGRLPDWVTTESGRGRGTMMMMPSS